MDYSNSSEARVVVKIMPQKMDERKVFENEDHLIDKNTNYSITANSSSTMITVDEILDLKQKLNDIFHKIDIDDNKMIDFDEFQRALRTLIPLSTPVAIEAIFTANKDYKIVYDEFLSSNNLSKFLKFCGYQIPKNRRPPLKLWSESLNVLSINTLNNSASKPDLYKQEYNEQLSIIIEKENIINTQVLFAHLY